MDVGGGAVPVVREALDEDGDAVGRVPLVVELLVLHALEFAGPALVDAAREFQARVGLEDLAILERDKRDGIDRIIVSLASGKADAILPELDRWARLIERLG